MATPLALVFDIVARDGASPVFDRVAVSADRAAVAAGRAEKSAVGFSGKMKAAFAGIGVAFIGAEMVKSAAQFQKSMLLIQTQAGATAGEVKRMSTALLGLSGKVATAPDQLATSLYHIESAGLRGAKALGVVKVAAEGAKVGNADLEETTNALTSAVVSGIKGVSNMQQAMGVLNGIVGTGDMKLSDLNDALGTGLLASARVFGVSIQEVGAALAVFGDNNIRGADAATKLRMVMQDLSKPAAHADDVLSKIHLTAEDLRTSLTQHGLNDALQLLKSHMTEAGITGSKMGAFLEDAFTKKAGVGLAILETQLGRFERKLPEISAKGREFGKDWAATTKTASFAFDRIKAQVEAFGISIGTKLLPYVAKAAQWLGTNLPKIIKTLWLDIQPLVQIVGAVLAGAFKVLVPIVRAAWNILAGLGNFFASHQNVVRGFALTIGALWVAFKGFTIVRAVLMGIPSLLAAISEKFYTANLAVQTFAGGWGTLVAGAGFLTGAIVAVTMAINTYQQHQAAVAADLANQAAQVDALTSAFQQDSGAIGKNTRVIVENRLQSAHMYDLANKIGVSYKTMTQAALGNADAQHAVNQALRDSGKGSFVVSGALAQLRTQLGEAHHAWQQQSDVQKQFGHDATVTATTADHLGTTMQDQVPKYFAITTITDNLRSATQILKGALTALDGVLSSAASEVAYQQGLKDLTKTFKDNKGAIDGNTTAALADRAAFISQAQQIVQNAEAMRQHGASVQKVTGYLKSHIAQLKEAAIKAGTDKTAVNNLTTALHLVPSVIRSEILMDTRTSLEKVAFLSHQIDILNHKASVSGVAATTAGSMSLTRAAGGAIFGPGTPTSDSVPALLSKGEHVLTASDVEKAGGQGAIYRMRQAIQAGVMKFAGGGGVDAPLFSSEGPRWYQAALRYFRPYAKGAPYTTRLSDRDEHEFERWVARRGVPFDPAARVADYDMRGYWLASNRGRNWHRGMHFPDRWKTPYDTTFSHESKYATRGNPFYWFARSGRQSDSGTDLRNVLSGQLVYRYAKGGAVAPTASNYFRAFLQGIGAPATNSNLRALYGVSTLEGWNNRYNPLNVIQPEPGSTAYNSVGVQTYPDLATGVKGAVDLFKRNGVWSGVIAALRSGRSISEVLSAFKGVYSGWDPGVQFPIVSMSAGSTRIGPSSGTLPDGLATGSGSGGGGGGGMGGPITVSKVNGKKVYHYGGQTYSTLSDAQSQQSKDRAARSSALSKGNSILSGIGQRGSGSQIDIGQTGVDLVERQLRDAGKRIANIADLKPADRARFAAGLKKLMEEAQRQIDKLALHIKTGDLKDFRKALAGSAADVRDSFKQIVGDLRHLGARDGLITRLRGLDKSIAKDVADRNRAAAKLANIQQRDKQFTSSVRGALFGSFDVTSAGTNPVSGNVTAGSLVAQQAQALRKVKLFGADLRKLENRGLNRAYLRQLASAGPSVLPQLEALLQMSDSQFGRFNRQEGALLDASQRIGGRTGNFFYGQREKELRAQEKAARADLQTLVKEFGKELRKGVNVTVEMDGKKLNRELDQIRKQLNDLHGTSS